MINFKVKESASKRSSKSFGKKALFDIAGQKMNQYSMRITSILFMTLFMTGLSTQAYAASSGGIFDTFISNITGSFSGMPGIFAMVAYLLGLFFAITAIIKFKTHVDNPRDEKLSSVVIRFLIGGMFFSFPVVVEAMIETIGLVDLGAPTPLPEGDSSAGLGQLLVNLDNAFQSPQKLFAFIAYVFGIGFALWALVEFIKSTDSPQQYPVRRPIMIMITASCLLATPTIITALTATFNGIASIAFSGGLTSASAGPALDQILARVIVNIHGPFLALLGDFCLIAGVAFAMIGIFRLMKSAQDGPKAPWGMGTIGTFLTAAALMAVPQFLGGVQTSMFGSTAISTYAVLANTDGMDPLIVSRANQAIQAVFMFVQLVGFISFVRGIFILRSYSEGDQQATMAAGLTHIFGGAIAVNLPAFTNAVQQTLGLVGLTF